MKHSLYILLVEDDLALGQATFDTLTVLGHRAMHATTVLAAYQHLIKPHDFQLVLLDLQLGEERGELLIHRLREEGIGVPRIVVFSAQPLHEIERAVRDIGAHGYVRKPAMMEDINRALAAAHA